MSEISYALQQKDQMTGIRLPKKVVESLKKIASKRGVKYQALIRHCIETHLENDTKKKESKYADLLQDTRITIRLPHSLIEAAGKAAQKRGLSGYQQFIKESIEVFLE